MLTSTPQQVADLAALARLAEALDVAGIPAEGAGLADPAAPLGPGNYRVDLADGATDADRRAADTLVAGWWLADARAQKCAAIDARTRALIAGGFEYPAGSGRRFSLSIEAQMDWTARLVAAAITTYPIAACTVDEASFTVPDAATAQDAYSYGAGQILRTLDSGRTIKIQVMAAATVDDVAAVVDGR